MESISKARFTNKQRYRSVGLFFQNKLEPFEKI